MIFFQSRDRSFLSFWIQVPVSIFAKITAGGTKRTARDINIESKFGGVFAFMTNGGKVCFTSKDGIIAIGPKNGG